MSSRTAEHARQPSQRLLLKRFTMALGSYALAILLVLLAYALGSTRPMARPWRSICCCCC